MMKETKQGTYIYGEENYTFKFTTNLSMFDKLQFIDSVVNTVISENNYNSIIRDLAFDYMLVKYFTDVNTEEIQNSVNMIDAIEQFLEETNIVDIIKVNVEFGLIDELNKAVDKSVEYKTGIHPSPLNDALASLVNTLEKKVKEFDMSGAMEMVQKFAGMTGELNVDSIVNAYINSDTHKKNLDEIAKSKKGKKSKKNEVKISESFGEAVRAVIEENKAEKTEVVE